MPRPPALSRWLAAPAARCSSPCPLAMGAMITYGSYLSKDESLTKNSLIIVSSDTIIALMAGFAVLPAAVANSMASGIPNNEMVLGGPKLLFITLQDVFSNMGPTGPLFGVLSTCWWSSPP